MLLLVIAFNFPILQLPDIWLFLKRVPDKSHTLVVFEHELRVLVAQSGNNENVNSA